MTNDGADAEEAFEFDVRIAGPAVRPDGTGSGDVVRTVSFPAGPSGQSTKLDLALDEASINEGNKTLRVTIAAPRPGQVYLTGTPDSATVSVMSINQVTRRTRQVIARHMNRVAALITSDTGRARLRDRQQAGTAGTATGGGGQMFQLGGHMGEGDGQSAGKVSFETSTNRVRGAARAATRDRLSAFGINTTKYGLGRNNSAGASTASTWDVWVTGKYSYQRTGDGADRSSGHAGLARAGADYLLDPTTLVGIMAQYDTSKDESARQGFKVNGQGWMVGPYFEKQLSTNLYFDAKLLGGQSSNKVSPFATYTDSFDTTRWLASVRLSGYWQLGKWKFTPSAELVTYRDRQTAYTDSNGLKIAGQTVRVNRLNVGPEISRRFVTSQGVTIEPRVAVRGLLRFGGNGSDVDKSDLDGLGIDTVEINGVQGRVEAGLRVQAPNGISVDLDGSYEGIGRSEESAASVSGRVRIPLQ